MSIPGLKRIPFVYMLKNFRTRKLTTAITIAGIALVVFVFAAVLMMAYGVQKTLVSTGEPDNVIVVRKGSNGEISSIVGGDVQGIIRAMPHIAKTENGELMLSAEPVVVINLDRFEGGISNITIRGVEPVVQALRPNVEILQGRMFNPSLRELIVGESISKRFKNAQLNSTIDFAGSNWQVVGIFSSNGSGFDSEIWGDAVQMMDAFNRQNTVSTITFKLDDKNNFDAFQRAAALDKRLNEMDIKIEQDYFGEQSATLSNFIRVLGTVITVIFSIGATLGAMITMYAAVANRTVEIGTLRALGFSRTSIMTVFLAESLVIALLGGGLGILFASFLQNYSVSTLNFDSFAELAFSFALNPAIIIGSLVFASVMGVVGGVLPSFRAARLKIVDALRSG